MNERRENKVSKSYSLDPEIISWVAQKAARLTIDGEPTNDSKLVNDILRDAMEKDAEDSPTTSKRKTNPRMRALAA